MYTDEVRLEVGFRAKRELVRRPPGQDNAYKPKYMVPTMSGDKVAVNFWGAITYNDNALMDIYQWTANEKED